ncbi:MAG: radical SAM/SPASM domain-containing protein [Candidatus Methanofastidiosia archaeon]
MKNDNQRFIPTKNALTMLKNVLDNLDPKLTSVFLSWAFRHPRYLRTFIRLVRSYKHTEQLRKDERLKGIMVPPFLIISITSRCNLSCTGCYAAAAGTICGESSKTHKYTVPQLDKEQWREIITEASELGVFSFVIAGGEPFLFPGLVELCKEFKDRFFLIVTNGTALTKSDFKSLKHSSNISIIVSIDGNQEFTNTRRGPGVYEKASNTLQRLNKIGVLTGISVTINRLNYQYWMDEKQLDSFIAQGVRIGVFIEYIPLTPGYEPSKQSASVRSGMTAPGAIKDDHALMLTKEERAMFRSTILGYRTKKQIYIIHSPGDEEFFGGCVSAGRGFAHITPAGDLTPCPVSNIATHNLTTATLREGLACSLFKEIRENEHLLETDGMPCALFAHPKEVDTLAKKVGAYRTGIE